MPTLNGNYWETRYQQGEIGWDMGSASKALDDYFKQIENKNIAILIPGCGSAYEAEALLKLGFQNITLIDFALSPLEAFRARNPEACKEGKVKLVCVDFFEHLGEYDLIMEQTFYCAINPDLREKYVKKMFSLLKPGGKLAGLLFNFPLTEEGPPFGGSREEYENRFGALFTLKTLEPCVNSIKPREGRELFFIFQKPA